MPEQNHKLLVIGPNWLGDAVMALPALQFWRRRRPPDDRLGVLSKPSLATFWSMHRDVDAVHVLAPGFRGTLGAVREIRAAGYDAVWILPNSFRSAFIARCGGIPSRHGAPGHWRRGLLNAPSPRPDKSDSPHQAWEYAAIFDIAPRVRELPPPELILDPAETEAVRQEFGLKASRRWIALLPGAARGPAKRWPAEYFAAAARLIAQALPGTGFVLCGTAAESPLCASVAREIGVEPVRDVSGRTDLPGLAAVFGQCAAVLCNDSGGMHLAAAVDVPVVAVFGLTDPATTGPLGLRKRILRPEGVRGRRDIPRSSETAERALRSISPETVRDALLDLLAGPAGGATPETGTP